MTNQPQGPTLRVLITGSKGFIGQHLKAFLRGKVQKIILWEHDVGELTRYKEPAEVVIHLAGASRFEQFIEAPYRCYEVNVVGTLAVLNYCKRVGARCVLASTSGVYVSRKDGAPVSEGSPVGPSLPYGISKLLAENLCREHAENFGVSSIVLRLFNVYGPGQHKSFLVAQIIDALVHRQPIVLRMPEALRDFVYVHDVVEAFLRAACSGYGGFKVFNIGSGIAIGVRDMVSIAERVFGPAVSIESGISRPGELSAAIADITTARKELGWIPKYDLESGMRAIKASWGEC